MKGVNILNAPSLYGGEAKLPLSHYMDYTVNQPNCQCVGASVKASVSSRGNCSIIQQFSVGDLQTNGEKSD